MELQVENQTQKIKSVAYETKKLAKKKMNLEMLSCDMKCFLEMKRLNNDICALLEKLEEIASEEMTSELELSFAPNEALLNTLKDNSLGKVSCATKRSSQVLEQYKNKQAQVVLNQVIKTNE